MNIKKIALSRALNMLKGADCTFKIIEPDGTEHGTLILATPAADRKRAPNKLPHGTLLNHAKPYLKDVMPGTAIVVPFGEFEGDSKESLRGTICAHLSKAWGHGSYITHTNSAGIEILRMD